jgi:hypothetical protein
MRMEDKQEERSMNIENAYRLVDEVDNSRKGSTGAPGAASNNTVKMEGKVQLFLPLSLLQP